MLRVSDQPRIEPGRLMRLIDQPGSSYRVSPDHRIHLKLRRSEDAIPEAFGLLELLAPERAAPANVGSAA